MEQAEEFVPHPLATRGIRLADGGQVRQLQSRLRHQSDGARQDTLHPLARRVATGAVHALGKRAQGRQRVPLHAAAAVGRRVRHGHPLLAAIVIVNE